MGWAQERVAKVVGITQQRVDQIEDTSITNICNACILDCRYKISKEQEDDIKVSDATVYFAIQFYIKWPELCNAFQSFTEGKNDNTGRMLRSICEKKLYRICFCQNRQYI